MQRGFWWRGWGMVCLGGLMDFVATGFFFYSYSVFFPVVAAEFNISRSGTSLGMSLFLIITALSSPMVARMLMHYPLRNIFSSGALLMAVGLVALSFAPDKWLLLPGVAIIAIGAASLGQIGPPRLVFNWFVRHRGIAMGVAAVGISLSGVLMPPVATQLIERLGWQETLQIYAAFAALVIMPLAFLATIERPEDVGMSPDGDPRQPPLPPPIRHMRRRYTLVMLTNPSVWLLALLFGCQFCAVSAVLTHLVPLAGDRGLDSTDAGLLVTITAAAAVVGKMLIGGASDRVSMQPLLLLSIALQATGIGLLFIWVGDLPMLVGACSFGLGFGGAVPLQNQLFARSFGSSMASAMGLSRPLMLPVQILGPPLTGLIYDSTGSYLMASYLLLSVLALAVVLVLLQPRLLRHQTAFVRRR